MTISAFSPMSAAPSADHKRLSAWLLLLLRAGDSHGWALFTQLRDLGLVFDSGRAYRALRELEGEGAVTSHWAASHSGPRRRAYHLTPEGRGRLDALARCISTVWEQEEAFQRERGEPGFGANRSDANRRNEGGSETGHSARSRSGERVTVSWDLLAAWLLALLDRESSYGYLLRSALDDRDVCVDSAAMYRVLRKLETDGYLRSQWVTSAAGPRRRLYRIDARGRHKLRELTDAIAAVRDCHAAFLRAYEGEPRSARSASG